MNLIERIEREQVWLLECECLLLRGVLAGDPDAIALHAHVLELIEMYAWAAFRAGHEDEL